MLAAWTLATAGLATAAAARPAVDASTTTSAYPPIHVALVLDGSQSMEGERTSYMKDGAGRLVDGLGLAEHSQRQVSVTEFRSIANRLCDLTNDATQAASCIERIDAVGGSRLDYGILDGLSALDDGRSGGSGTAAESLVALADGSHAVGCQPVLNAADRAKEQGVTVYTICLGAECDPACLLRAASGPDQFNLTMREPLLIDVFEAITQQILDAVTTPTATLASATGSATPTSSPADTSTSTPTSGTATATVTPTTTRLPTIALTPPTATAVTASATRPDGGSPTADVATSTESTAEPPPPAEHGVWLPIVSR